MANIEELIRQAKMLPGKAKEFAGKVSDQYQQDISSMDKPHAVTDVLNRGLVAGTLGAPVDMVNTVLTPFGLGSEHPMLGSEHIGDLMEKYGMVSDTRRPVLEMATNLAPMLVNPAMAAGKVAARELGPMAAGKLEDMMAKQGMIMHAAPRGTKVVKAAEEAAPATPLTPAQQSVLDNWGSKHEREAKLKKRVAEDEAEQLANESAGSSSEKTVQAKGSNAAIPPDYWRKMAETQGDAKVLAGARAGKHLRPDGNGGYIGGPRTVSSPQGLGKMRKDIDTDFSNSVDAVQMADPERMGTWYDRAKSGIAQSVEPHQLDPVLGQHAAYSAGVSPEMELSFSLKHLNSRALGEPGTAYRGAVMRKLDEAEAEGRPIDLAFKTDEYRNKNDPRIPNAGLFGVNDFRRAQGMGYTDPQGNPWKAGVSDTMHPFMDAETALQMGRANQRGIGGRTDWNGAHIQELPWVYGKGQDIYTRGENKRFAGEGIEGISKALREANNTTRDYIYKHAGSATHEAVPGASTGHVPHMLEASPEEKLAYGQQGRFDQPTPYLLNEAPSVGAGRRDAIYSALGLRQMPSELGTGAYMNSKGVMEHNPLTIARPLLDFPTGGGGGRIDPLTQKAMELSEQFRAIQDAQEAGAFNLPNTKGHVTGKNALVLDTRHLNPNRLEDPSMGVLPTKDQLSKLIDLIDKHGFSDKFGVTPTSRGATIFPYDPLENPKSITALLKKMGPEIQGVYPSHVQKSLNSTGYVPGIGKWGEKGIEPTTPYTGEATMNFLKNAAEAPQEISTKIGESEGVRKAIKGKIERDAPLPGARGDIQETRRFFAEADWPKAVKLVRGGMDPLAALAALGYSASSMAQEKTK
jgi:hypothetical protein